MTKRGVKPMDMVINLIVGAFLGSIGFLFGGWSTMLSMLAVVLVIEVLTGLAKGAMNKNIDSKVFARGMVKKGSIFVVIILSHFLDVLLGFDMAFMLTTIFYYIGIETVSILENLAKMGVPVPKFIRERFQQLADTAEEQAEIIESNKQDNTKKKEEGKAEQGTDENEAPEEVKEPEKKQDE